MRVLPSGGDKDDGQTLVGSALDLVACFGGVGVDEGGAFGIGRAALDGEG
jgi:hypothetical protein